MLHHAYTRTRLARTNSLGICMPEAARHTLLANLTERRAA